MKSENYKKRNKRMCSTQGRGRRRNAGKRREKGKEREREKMNKKRKERVTINRTEKEFNSIKE